MNEIERLEGEREAAVEEAGRLQEIVDRQCRLIEQLYAVGREAIDGGVYLVIDDPAAVAAAIEVYREMAKANPETQIEFEKKRLTARREQEERTAAAVSGLLAKVMRLSDGNRRMRAAIGVVLDWHSIPAEALKRKYPDFPTEGGLVRTIDYLVGRLREAICE